MNNTDCPLCDAKPEDWQALAEHLIAHHSTVEINGRKLFINKKRTARCWCGAYFELGRSVPPWFGDVDPADWPMGRFARHLKARGGAAAHILELALGVKRK